MNFRIVLLLFLTPFFSAALLSQQGPGGVGSTDGNSNLQLWLIASDLKDFLNEGDDVTKWRDNSGASNDLIALNPNKAPRFSSGYGEDQVAVVFDGAQYLQTEGTSSSFNNPESTIFLVKAGQYSGTSIAIASNGWVNEMLLFNYSQYHHSSSGNFEQLKHPCIQQIPSDELALICAVFGQQPTDLRYIVNSYESELGLFSPGNAWAYDAIDRKVTLGQRDQFVSSEYFNGALLEVIVYNTKLTDEEILFVEDYIQCKYRLKPGNTCTEMPEDACQFQPLTARDELLAVQVELFPNPASDHITLTINAVLPTGDLSYRIFDQLGRQMAANVLSSTVDGKIDVSQLSKGIYYLQLNINDQLVLKKIVLN